MRTARPLALFAVVSLAVSAAGGVAQPPKKDGAPKLNQKKIAAAEAALTAAKCQFVREANKKDALVGQVRVVNFPATATDADLTKLWASLNDLPALNAVDVGGCAKVTDAGVFELARLPDLEALYLDGTGISNKGLAFFSGNKKLFWLDVSRTAVTDDGMKAVGKMEGLEHLTLAGAKVGNDGLAHLAELQWIRDLTMPALATEEGLKHIANMRMLTRLHLGPIRVGDKGAEVIGGLPRLESLSVHSGLLTDVGLQSLLGCTSLHSLALDGNRKVTAAQVPGFEQMQKLTHLTLSGCGITDDGLKSIAKCPSLTNLSVSNTGITAAGVPELAELKKLVTLNMNDTPADNKGLQALEKVKTLKDVHAVETKVNQSGANHFMQAVPGSMVWLKYPPPPKAVAGAVVRDPGKPNRVAVAGGSPKP